MKRIGKVQQDKQEEVMMLMTPWKDVEEGEFESADSENREVEDDESEDELVERERDDDDDNDEAQRVEQELELIAQKVRRRFFAVGPADRRHQRVRRAVGEVNGKHQREPQELPARIAPHIDEVLLDDIQCLLRHDGVQSREELADVERHHTDKVAQKDEQREDGEKKIIGQRRAVASDMMVKIASSHQVSAF